MSTRHGGTHYIVQFHLELPSEISLLRSHEILDDVESLVRSEYPDCEIIIHADPHGIPESTDAFEAPLATGSAASGERLTGNRRRTRQGPGSIGGSE